MAREKHVAHAALADLALEAIGAKALRLAHAQANRPYRCARSRGGRCEHEEEEPAEGDAQELEWSVRFGRLDLDGDHHPRLVQAPPSSDHFRAPVVAVRLEQHAP